MKKSGAAIVGALALLAVAQPTYAAQFYYNGSEGFQGICVPNVSVPSAGQAIWTNVANPTASYAVPGNTYEVVANAIPIGNNVNNARVRAYGALAGALANGGHYPFQPVTFPGDALQLDQNAELRLKDSGGTVYSFPGVGGNPGLILNGGFITTGDNYTANTVPSPDIIEYIINGVIQAVPGTTSWLCTGNNDFASVDNTRSMQLAGQIIGTGALVICQGGSAHTNILVTGTNASFSGTWIDKAGWFVAGGVNSLGTNSSIVIDPDFPLLAPPFNANIYTTGSGLANGPAVLEVWYNVNSAGTLALTNGGRMLLHQDCAFSAVTVEGTPLSAGTHFIAELTGLYTNFTGNGCSGSITVQAYNPNGVAIAPQISQEPLPAVVYAGDTARIGVSACGSPPLSYQWQRNGTNLADGGNISGSLTANLSVSGASGADVAPYDVIISHPGGSITSSVVTLMLTVPTGESYENAVLTNGPIAFYEFNELGNPATGVEAFDFVGSYNGTYGNAVQNGFNSIAGPIPPAYPGFLSTNTAAFFTNGVGTSQVIVPAWNLNTNTVTITAWVNPNGPQTNNIGLVVCRGGTTLAGLNYTSSTNANGNFTLGSVWGINVWNSQLAPAPGQWSFVALVITPSNNTMYVISGTNLVSSAQPFNNANEAFDGQTYIGDDSADKGTGARGFNGTIDDVAVFNSALSQSQLVNLYSAASGVSTFAPTIAVQPISRGPLYTGVPVQFSVAAGGSTPLAYQWKAGATGSGIYTNLSDGSGVSGSSTAALSINPTTSASAADYVVVITNSNGQVTSSPATLSLIPASTESPTTNAVALGPVAFYEFDETNDPAAGGAIAYDYVGGYNGAYGLATQNGNAGYNIAGPTPSAGFANFFPGNTAVKFFNGFSASQVIVPAWNLNSSNITLTAWINPISTSGQANAAGLIMCRAGTTAAGLDYTSIKNANGDLVLGYTWNNNDPNTYSWNSGLVAPANQWSLVALVVTGPNATLFVINTNGLKAAIHTYPHIQEAFDGQTYIGDDPFDGDPSGTGGRVFNGTIDNVAVFNKALTTNQVLSLFITGWGQPAFPVSITSQPRSKSLFTGLTANFTLGVQGSSPFSYQWQAGATGSGIYTNLVANQNHVSGSVTGPSLVITNISAGQTADYLAIVTNAENAVTSSVATLTVVQRSGEGYETAAINSQPVAFYEFNELGNPANGNLVAYDYVGGFNGVYGTSNLNGFDGIAGPQPITGFPNFLATNVASQFTAYVTNNGGNSIAATNSIVTLPPWNLNTNTVTIVAWINPNTPTGPTASGIVMCRNAGITPTGTTVAGLTLGNNTINGNAQLGYNWNNDPATYGFNSAVVAPPGQWSFIALAVSPAEATLYVFNTNGPASSTFVHTHANALFDGTILVGDDSYDSSGASGQSPGDRVFNGTVDDVAVYNSTLSVNQLSSLYAAASGVTYLPATVTKSPTNLTVVAGQNAQFNVTASGGALSYQWEYAQHGTGLFTNLTDGLFVSGSTTSTLVLSNVTLANAGDYVVGVSNGLGSTLSSPVATLTVLPPLPARITNTTLVGTTLTLAGSGGQPGGPYYVVTSTNLTIPLSNWVAIATNNFDTSGHFSVSTTYSASDGQRFYLIESPY